MSEAMARAHACDLFDSVLSGLEWGEMQAHLRRETGEVPSQEDVAAVEDEWLRVRDYLARRRRRLEREAGA
ncbi:hypothetical protein [Micromonospora sp. NPDC047730]|uniref:hypothetical protein n=1 Tax=Micromonospora sp. NPDC047730 TaxID=3364253 RepID=UPI0037192C1C